MSHILSFISTTRGGVKDTRLETKAKAKDTDANVLQKKKGFQNFFQAISKKRSSKIFFRRSLLEETKKRSFQIFRKASGVFHRNFNGSKIVLSSSRGQGNFRGLEASRPRPRTSKCVLEDIVEAKDVREDSTSVNYGWRAKIVYLLPEWFCSG